MVGPSCFDFTSEQAVWNQYTILTPTDECISFYVAALELPRHHTTFQGFNHLSDLIESYPESTSDLQHEGSASPNLSGAGVLLSWICSIAFHILLLGAMYILVFPYSAPRAEVEHPVTFAQIIGEVDATGSVPAPPSNVTPPSSNSIIPPSTHAQDARLEPRISSLDAVAGGALGHPTGNLPESAGGLGGSGFPGVPVIGLGAGTPGRGDDSGTPGLSIGGSGNVSFFGLQSTAPGVRSIVYVVDRSYSMVGIMDIVKAELRRSINALRRSQKFHVVFYNSGVPLQNPPEELVPAIQTHKTHFFKFLDSVDPIGGSEPLNAMRVALALRPDVIYFLSDGEFVPEVADVLLERLRDWNVDRKTRIYTLGYNELSHMETRHRKILWTIAREHGGEYRFVSDENQ